MPFHGICLPDLAVHARACTEGQIMHRSGWEKVYFVPAGMYSSQVRGKSMFNKASDFQVNGNGATCVY
eukprot:1141218-Pelagomonas_calceolata.AAC.2